MKPHYQYEKECVLCKKRYTTMNKPQKYCSRKCYGESRRKYWSIPECLANADRRIDHLSGYVRVYCPLHPKANTRGYVYEHRLIMEQHLGRLLQQYEHVHHRNSVRWDNRLENLQCLTASEHGKIKSLSFSEVDLLFGVGIPQRPRCHRPQRQHIIICCTCGQEFIRGHNAQFCSAKCVGLANRKVQRPSKDELVKMLWQEPTTTIAAKYGVSDQAVAKWAKNYGIAKPPRGYWS